MEKRNATGCSRLLWLLILLGIIAATLYYTQVIGVVPLLLVCIFVCVIGYFVDLRGYNHGYAKALGRPTAVLSREKTYLLRKIVAIVDSHDPNEEFSKKYQLVLSPIPQFWEKKMPLENLPVILYEGEVSNTIDALTEGHYYTVNEYYPGCFMLKV